ncbi:formate/nitrite transporter FocA (FNT family) [Sphingomonas jinjuensis]|uniref:Formate/nitrite transporter FocA (FNT family) n=1 Tax=Sphingomonas jinjuensis TaxID=535907 RepID=A0A840FAD3_9SPHN|nr:formate/nitrite transporter family protein [Sphingomonas jinjuensis]MBB4153246.1 formate/nitrite transporter FocA (FNT family) [Sphingomonas jinjuensis]
MTEPDSRDEDDDLKAARPVDLHRTVREEGEEELERPFKALFWSGLAAGLAITSSLVAEAVIHSHLPDTQWRPLLVALGYPFGFLVVILGRMQLFTESTITAMLPLATRPSFPAFVRTLRLWGIVLGANLVGTAITGAALAYGWVGDAAIGAAAHEISLKITELGPLDTFVNAIPAGFMIAIIAWSLPNAREQSFWVIGVVTYLVAAAGFSHSVVGSNEAWLLLFAGDVGLWSMITSLLLPAVFGNLVGGAGIFALLAHAQVRSDVED